MRADVFLDPGQGSRIKYQAAWIPSATAIAVGKIGGRSSIRWSRASHATTGYRTSHLRWLSRRFAAALHVSTDATPA